LILLLILIAAVNFLAKVTSNLATMATLLPVLASLVLIRQVLDRLSEPYLNMNPIENRDGAGKKRKIIPLTKRLSSRSIQKYWSVIISGERAINRK